MSELILAGFELMLIGMAVVFCFLVLLVGLINLSNKAITRYFPTISTQPSLPREPNKPNSANSDIDPGTIAAITSAIKMHRARR